MKFSKHRALALIRRLGCLLILLCLGFVVFSPIGATVWAFFHWGPDRFQPWLALVCTAVFYAAD